MTTKFEELLNEIWHSLYNTVKENLKAEYDKLQNEYKLLDLANDNHLRTIQNLSKTLKETENSLRSANLRIMELEKANDKLVETYHIERLELMDKKCTGCIIVQELKKENKQLNDINEALSTNDDDFDDYDSPIKVGLENDPTDLD